MSKTPRAAPAGSAPQQAVADWPTVSPAARDVIRQSAEMAFNLPVEWRREFEEAGFGGDALAPVEDDPVIRAASRRNNWAALQHWASANIQKPGERVPYYVTPDMKHIALELAGRGQLEVLWQSSHAVQDAAWRLCMKVTFLLAQDPMVLKETLDISFHSVTDFLAGNNRILASLIHSTGASRSRDSHLDKLQLVNQLLEGKPVSGVRAGSRLGHALEQMHCAAILWSEIENPRLSDLEEAARAFARSLDAPQPLVVVAGSATLWAWCAAQQPVNRRLLDAAIRKLPGTRVAIGGAGRNLAGFRRTHMEAITVQRVLGRLNSTAPVASIDQVRLVSLMMQDPKAARHFVNQTLGGLAQADAPLLESLRIFLGQGCNLSEAARVLHTHRNTVLRRIARAESLLPQPLAEARLNVAAALELLSWTSSLPAGG